MEKQNTKRAIGEMNLCRFLCLLAAVYGLWELLGNLVAGVLYLCMKDSVFMAGEAASIGIIGGADGPTAVFITTPGWVYGIVPVLFLIAGLTGFFFLNKQHKESSEGEE